MKKRAERLVEKESWCKNSDFSQKSQKKRYGFPLEASTCEGAINQAAAKCEHQQAQWEEYEAHQRQQIYDDIQNQPASLVESESCRACR